jgi:hypothetical protein
VEVLSLLGDGVHEFVAAMSDFHTYWEHRLKDTRQMTIGARITRAQSCV